VSWSVAPADESGPDGRHWVELTLAPGDKRRDYFAVTNRSQVEATFALTAADGYFNRNGRFTMLNNPSESVAAGTWIEVADSVTVAPDETAVVPFTVTVPASAEPGDHAAGIAASVVALSASADGSAGLKVTSRFGFRVMTRVTGDLAPELELSGLKGSLDISWNPLRPGRLTAGFDLVNRGNARLVVTGQARSGGQSTDWPASGESQVELLPGETRHIDTTVAGVWPLVRVKILVSAVPEVIALDGVEATGLAPLEASAAVWVAPWPWLLALLSVALLVGAALTGRSHSRRRLARVTAEAREQGRREALRASRTERASEPDGNPADAHGDPSETRWATRAERRAAREEGEK
jgi:hypothetical protein